MTVSFQPTLTLSLAATGGSAFIPIGRNRLIGLKLTAPSTTAAGFISFRLANGSADTSPNAMTSPIVPVVAGTAINEFVDLIDVSANFVQVYWTATTGEAVDLTISLAAKE